MSKKAWKDHFLSSGVPLEYSVAQIFEEVGGWRTEEFSYERKNEEGIEQVFSVDFQSTHFTHKGNLWLETLVECKYRHDDTKWLFTPYAGSDYDERWGTDLSTLFVTLDQCCADKKVDWDVLGKFGRSYPLCERGIEILRDDANPKSIEQALRQLRYAVTAKALHSIETQLTMLEAIAGATHIVVVVPIIVTTAELWRLRPGTTVESIRRATDVAEVAESYDVLVLRKKPDNLETNYAEAAVSEAFTETELKRLHTLLDSGRDGLARIMGHIVNKPSLFLVIRYGGLRSALADLYNFFAQEHLVQPRPKRSD